MFLKMLKQIQINTNKILNKLQINKSNEKVFIDKNTPMNEWTNASRAQTSI